MFPLRDLKSSSIKLECEASSQYFFFLSPHATEQMGNKGGYVDKSD